VTVGTRRGWSLAVAVGFAAIGLGGLLWATAGDGIGSSTAVDAELVDAEVLALGARTYAVQCAACHGARGEGAADWRSPGSDGRLPPPPHDVSGHTWHHGDGLLFRIVRDGCDAYPPAARDRCAMPAFGERLADAEIRAVIEHLKTWWGEEERAYQVDRSREDPYP
jgi:mono/diheme cytochrome c family protein